jgi:hydroxyacylglutathione hydrolase
MLEIHHTVCLRDNYVWLLREPNSGKVAVVDPSEAEPVKAALDRLGWKPDYILNTHHHTDHVGGNLALKAATHARIVGPRPDRERIPGIDVAVGEGDSFALGDESATVFEVPGHTRGHIAFWFRESAALFSGDTLFTCGCGRMFEGSPQQMWGSLKRLRALPGNTRVYCGHEYTQSNARFAASIDPDNQALRARGQTVDNARAAGKPTVPALLAEECATNPFLRADDAALAARMGLDAADPVAVFAAIRQAKDRF